MNIEEFLKNTKDEDFAHAIRKIARDIKINSMPGLIAKTKEGIATSALEGKTSHVIDSTHLSKNEVIFLTEYLVNVLKFDVSRYAFHIEIHWDLIDNIKTNEFKDSIAKFSKKAGDKDE